MLRWTRCFELLRLGTPESAIDAQLARLELDS